MHSWVWISQGLQLISTFYTVELFKCHPPHVWTRKWSWKVQPNNALFTRRQTCTEFPWRVQSSIHPCSMRFDRETSQNSSTMVEFRHSLRPQKIWMILCHKAAHSWQKPQVSIWLWDWTTAVEKVSLACASVCFKVITDAYLVSTQNYIVLWCHIARNHDASIDTPCKMKFEADRLKFGINTCCAKKQQSTVSVITVIPWSMTSLNRESHWRTHDDRSTDTPTPDDDRIIVVVRPVCCFSVVVGSKIVCFFQLWMNVTFAYV